MKQDAKKRHRLRFNNWSRVYDKSILQWIVFNTSHNTFFREISFMKKDLKVLDVGCGTGKFALKLHSWNRDLKVHGVDLSEDMIKKAKAKLSDEPIEFKIGDVEELPYESHTFDIITCTNSFHQYPNQKKAISEMHRVLNKDGKLMIIDGCRDTLLGRFVFGIVEIVEKQVRHIFQRELKDMLQSEGFENISQKRFNPIAPLLFTSGHAKKERREQ